MSRIQLIFEKQWLHVLLLAGLGGGLYYAAGLDTVRTGQLWGIGTLSWLWLAAGIAIIHQGYVWLCWRTELYASALTGILGTWSFTIYAVGFTVLALTRVGGVLAVAISNTGTLPSNPVLWKMLALILLLPNLYLFYSVMRYFGFKRAFGIDHFEPQYRSMPLEQRGIFRYTRNAMYVYGLLLLWVIALWYTSFAAALIALFNHAYVWAHYYATERPDMRRIYGDA